MSYNNRNVFNLKYLFVALLIFCLPIIANAQLHIIPQPAKITEQKGAFLLKNNMTIWAGGASYSSGIYLKNYLSKYYGIHINITNKKWIFPVSLDYDTALAKGSYKMEITPKAIRIKGHPDGVFYAVQSLIQLL